MTPLFLLRKWLYHLAAQRVRQKLAKTAQPREPADTPPPDDPEAAAMPCQVAVLFALPIEAGGFDDRLRDPVTLRGPSITVRRGVLDQCRVVSAVSGAGRAAAAKACEAVIDVHRPAWLISAGFAGGLHPELRRHDLLMADRLVDAEALAGTPGVHVGRLLTVDRVVRTTAQKRALAKRFEAAAVDMETFAVAEACRRRKVRFLAVRVINDALDDELPPDVERLLMQTSTAGRWGAAAGAVWRRPSAVRDFYRLREDAILASERLATFLAGMISQLG